MFLLLCNALGYTFVFFLNEWQENHRVRDTSFVEIKGDKLIFKVQISLPYQAEWERTLVDGNTAIFEGEFFKSYEQIYRGDTLYTYYKRLDLSRDNVLALMSRVHENLNLFSEKHKTTSQKALAFFKNFSKDYVEIYSKTIAWFWIENVKIENNFQYFSSRIEHVLSVISPPPLRFL